MNSKRITRRQEIGWNWYSDIVDKVRNLENYIKSSEDKKIIFESNSFNSIAGKLEEYNFIPNSQKIKGTPHPNSVVKRPLRLENISIDSPEDIANFVIRMMQECLQTDTANSAKDWIVNYLRHSTIK